MGTVAKLLPVVVSVAMALMILDLRTSVVDGSQSLVQAVPPPDSVFSADKAGIIEGLSTAQVAGARLAPPHTDYGLDEDMDGLKEKLIVNVTIEVFVEDRYGVGGNLRDGTGSITIAYWSMWGALEVGLRKLCLLYPGESIMQSEIDGPYLIDDLTLYLESTFEALDHGEYTTRAYEYEEFEVAATFLPPSAPRSLIAVAGDAYVSLSWQPPQQNGTSPVQLYYVYRGTESGSLSLLTDVHWALEYNDTGLANDCTYYYQVSARNILLEGPCSAEVSATPMADNLSPSEDDSSTGDSPLLAVALLVGGAVLATCVVGAVYVLRRRKRSRT